MVGAELQNIFTGLLEVAVLAGAAVYAGLVVTNYRTEGAQIRPRVDFHDPTRSAERLAVWLGARSLALAVRMGTPVFGMLSEASADVGDWFLSHRHRESQ